MPYYMHKYGCLSIANREIGSGVSGWIYLSDMPLACNLSPQPICVIRACADIVLRILVLEPQTGSWVVHNTVYLRRVRLCHPALTPTPLPETPRITWRGEGEGASCYGMRRQFPTHSCARARTAILLMGSAYYELERGTSMKNLSTTVT